MKVKLLGVGLVGASVLALAAAPANPGCDRLVGHVEAWSAELPVGHRIPRFRRPSRRASPTHWIEAHL